MDRSKGIAFCGLACAVCSENRTCVDKEWCKNLNCCKTKGISGCWECDDFPCKGNMLDKPRVRTFASLVKENGVEALLDCLEKSERAGVKYHYPGKLVGDYDVPETEDGIINMILNGKQAC
jgi:hypothetical protein